jgi:hypothetical protein
MENLKSRGERKYKNNTKDKTSRKAYINKLGEYDEYVNGKTIPYSRKKHNKVEKNNDLFKWKKRLGSYQNRRNHNSSNKAVRNQCSADMKHIEKEVSSNFVDNYMMPTQTKSTETYWDCDPGKSQVHTPINVDGILKIK